MTMENSLMNSEVSNKGDNSIENSQLSVVTIKGIRG